MGGRTISVRVGEAELLVETTPVAGSEPTSRTSESAERVVDAFIRAQRAIIEVAGSTADVLGQAARRGARPDQLEVEFGLKISAQGNVIVAGSSAEATLRVKLTYDSRVS